MTKVYIKLLIILILFILIINLAFAVNPESWIEAPTFFDWGEYDSNFDPGQELNWYSLADWEHQVCSATLSSQFFYDSDGSVSHINLDGRVYDETVAVNADVIKTEFTDENDNIEYLLSVGWYIQAANLNNADRTVKYKIRLRPDLVYLDLGEGETEKEFTLITGASGFFSNYTIFQQKSVDLIIDNEVYSFDIEGIVEAYG